MIDEAFVLVDELAVFEDGEVWNAAYVVAGWTLTELLSAAFTKSIL